MPEYIEREAVSKAIVDEQAVNHVSSGNALYEIGYHNGLSMAMAMVLKAPAADVVAVCRCRDCIALYREDELFAQHCYLTGKLVEDMDFCSYGAGRSDNATE